ncbi:MAG TPA: tetratricopeptide repeat protein [Candidatus Omnitrophota bacterium]|nr:tetratricopeptide repeat protein [Candidatus Omnitrophota bacterium]HPD84189.1 tetratricopeptide repeat protein [Candidatus Omnitrophota bacterium]HRZ03045.1 tetratricopeptide repeat protein [Candidatus Omnitrophota bacterium]
MTAGFPRNIKEYFLSICLFIAAGFALYGHTLKAPFLFDDMPVIVQNPFIRDMDNLNILFAYDPTRFLTHLTFAVNYYFGGPNPFYFHLTNLLIHIAASFLFFRFVNKALVVAVPEWLKDQRDRNIFSLFCALIFLAHPLQTESVTYIVQRSTALAAFFYFLALILYLKIKTDYRWYYYLTLWVVVVLGSMTKPIFITLPAVVLLYEFCFFNSSRRQWKNDVIKFLPYASVLLIIPVFLTIFLLNYSSQRFDLSKIFLATKLTSEISRVEYLLTQVRVIVTYIRLLFIPVNQNLDYDYPLAYHLLKPEMALSFLFLGAVIFYGFRMLKNQRLIAFSLFWFFIVLIPESSIFPIPDVIFEHRLYIAVAGFAMLVCTWLSLFVRNRGRRIFFLSLIVLALGVLTYARNVLWENPVTLYLDVVQKSPFKARPHNNLGILYRELGWVDLAEGEYKKAITLDKNYVPAYNNLARIYMDRNNYEEATRLYQEALRLFPEHFESNLNLGNAYYSAGKLDSAKAQYLKTIRLRPGSDSAYVNLGYIHMHLNNLLDAEMCFRRAVGNNSYFAPAYHALGTLYFSQGLYDKAIEEFKKTILLDSRHIDAYTLLGICYVKTKKMPEAERCFRKTIEIKPDYTIGYLNLSRYYAQSGDREASQKFLAVAARIQEQQRKKAPR